MQRVELQRGIHAVEVALVLLEGAVDYFPARNRDDIIKEGSPAADVAEAARFLRHALNQLPEYNPK